MAWARITVTTSCNYRTDIGSSPALNYTLYSHFMPHFGFIAMHIYHNYLFADPSRNVRSSIYVGFYRLSIFVMHFSLSANFVCTIFPIWIKTKEVNLFALVYFIGIRTWCVVLLNIQVKTYVYFSEKLLPLSFLNFITSHFHKCTSKDFNLLRLFSWQAATRSCFYAGFAAQRNFAEVISSIPVSSHAY